MTISHHVFVSRLQGEIGCLKEICFERVDWDNVIFLLLQSVIVKSIERNASNMYLARLLLLGIEKEIPRQQTPSNGESQPTYDFSLSKLFSNIFYAF